MDHFLTGHEAVDGAKPAASDRDATLGKGMELGEEEAEDYHQEGLNPGQGRGGSAAFHMSFAQVESELC